MDLTLRHLRMIVALADIGSETGAAAELGMTQPAVSVQLKRLESAMGLLLFSRVPGGVEPTSNGALVAEYARRAVSAHEELNDQLESLSNNAQRAFRIVSVAYGAGIAAPRILRTFFRAWPDVGISMDQVPMQDRLGGLLDGNADVVFTLGPIDHPDIEKRLLFDDPVVAAVATDSPIASLPAVHIADLLDEPIIAGPVEDESRDPEWHEFWLAQAHRGQRPPRIAGRYASPELHLDAVAIGQGISLVSATTGELYHRSDVTYVPVIGMAHVPHWIAWSRATRKRALVESLVDIATQTVAQHRLGEAG